MLKGNESISYYSPQNFSLWMVMAFQGGTLNIGGYMACHRFVSHVTGFATLIGFEFSQMRYQHVLGLIAVPLFFLFGAMLSGLLVDLRLKTHRKPKYYISFGLIFALLQIVYLGGALGYFGEFGESSEQARDYVVLAVLCLVCGVQNGTISTVSKSVIRTTHLTGITTDLGIGLVRVLHRRKLAGEIGDEVAANLMRIGIISFFLLGSIVGAFIFRKAGYLGFILPTLTSGILFITALYFQVLKRKTPLA